MRFKLAVCGFKVTSTVEKRKTALDGNKHLGPRISEEEAQEVVGKLDLGKREVWAL
jgi:hypothetical protein